MKLLIINMTDSRCDECGRSCDPHEKAHQTNLGWNTEVRKQPGCGAVYTHVSSDYLMESLGRTVQEMRPDLEWISPLERRFQ